MGDLSQQYGRQKDVLCPRLGHLGRRHIRDTHRRGDADAYGLSDPDPNRGADSNRHHYAHPRSHTDSDGDCSADRHHGTAVYHDATRQPRSVDNGRFC